ncbi:MAG: glucose 1-dehydrogenase [Chloroflexi bacterium]|nr:glucose 1-dehydrogenase [Chloroflexota bacterium]
MRLKDRVVIVTGAAQGIGRIYALGLAEEGAKVVVADVDYAGAVQTADEIRGRGWEALAAKTDVSDQVSADAMARSAIERFGQIDVLVNNAALFVALLPPKPFHEITSEQWDRTMAVNVKGLFHCCKAVFPHMKARGKGKIINISSGTVLGGSRWHPFLDYVTSKAAVIGFTRQLAVEVGDHGINVNAVTPGLTASEGVEKMYAAQALEGARLRRCLKREERPDDLLGTIVFLASVDSDFITGQVINVDGGSNLH